MCNRGGSRRTSQKTRYGEAGPHAARRRLVLWSPPRRSPSQYATHSPHDSTSLAALASLPTLAHASLHSPLSLSRLQTQVLAQDYGVGQGAALRYAAFIGAADIVKVMLEVKANPYQCDHQADTALVVAARNGHRDVCELLCRRSPTLNKLRNARRQSAYDLVVTARHSAVHEVFAPSISEEEMRNSFPGFDAFVATYARGAKGAEQLTLEVLEKFFGRAAASGSATADEATTALERGLTPIMLACRLGSERALHVIRAMLDEKMSNPEWLSEELGRTTESGSCALSIAAERGNEEIVRLLLEQRAEVNMQDRLGRTALAFAAHSGHVGVIQLLLQNHADVSIQRFKDGARLDKDPKPGINVDRRTVLMLACHHGHHDVAQMLLDNEYRIDGRSVPNRSDINAVNYVNESALTFCTRYGHTDAARLLLQRGITLDHELREPYWTSLHRAAANGHDDTVRVLLREVEKRHPEQLALLVNHKNRRGLTALMAAARSNYSTTVGLLIEANADVLSQNKSGETTLHLTAGHGQTAALRELLKLEKVTNKQNLNATCFFVKSKDGPKLKQTALMAACRNAHEGAARALLREKADTHCTEEDGGDDALAIVVRLGHDQLVRLLLSHSLRSVPRAYEIAEEELQKSKGDAVEYSRREKIVELLKLQRTKLKRGLTETALLAAEATAKKAGYPFDPEMLPETIEKGVKMLTFKKQYNGQLVPPRPSRDEVERLETPAGPLVVHKGIVHQRGAHRGIFMRAGCIPGVHWHLMWQTLKLYVAHHCQHQAEQQKPAAIYICVSQRCMQAIDFTWLASRGFRFHHYRKAGHGDTVALHSPDSCATAEFVYYCWPGPGGTGSANDMVPSYATSIEGATGVLLSPDEQRILLVWERRSWSTPGGAVNEGESTLAALAREAHEEVNVTLDLDGFGAYLVGGWHESRARENTINDHFSAFVVRMTSDEFAVDNKEIEKARLFEWRPLLQAWRDQSKPDPFLDPASGDKMNKHLMTFLDLYDLGKCFKCRLKNEDRPDNIIATKLSYVA